MSRTKLLAGTMSIAILASFAILLLFLDSRGKLSRVYTGPGRLIAETLDTAAVVNTSKDLYDFYKSRGVHGRVLIHLGRYLHTLDIDMESLIPRTGRYNDTIDDLLASFERNISYGNVFWVASQGNIVREAYFVQPHEMFIKRLNSIDERDPDLLLKRSNSITIHDWGSRRTISDKMPHLNEPALINIDASVFEEIKPEELFILLQNSSVKTDLITLNLSRDNPDVSEDSRKALLLFANKFSKGKG